MHPTSADDQIRLVLQDEICEVGVVCCSGLLDDIGVFLARFEIFPKDKIVVSGWDASFFCAGEALDGFLVRYHPDNGGGGEKAGRRSIYESLEIGAAARYQNGQLGGRRRVSWR